MNSPTKKVKLPEPDYINPATLTPFISETFGMLPASINNQSRAFQRKLSKEIKRARFLALMPYCEKHTKVL